MNLGMRNGSMLTLAAVLLAGCQAPAKPASGDQPAEAAQDADAAPAAEDAEAAEATDASGDADASELSNEERLAKARAYAAENKNDMFKVEPLTDEDKRLIAADPETLSSQERTARAYALRKQILQDPNSPQAKALKDAANNIVDGGVDPNLNYKDEGQSSVPPAE